MRETQNIFFYLRLAFFPTFSFYKGFTNRLRNFKKECYLSFYFNKYTYIDTICPIICKIIGHKHSDKITGIHNDKYELRCIRCLETLKTMNEKEYESFKRERKLKRILK